MSIKTKTKSTSNVWLVIIPIMIIILAVIAVWRRYLSKTRSSEDASSEENEEEILSSEEPNLHSLNQSHSETIVQPAESQDQPFQSVPEEDSGETCFAILDPTLPPPSYDERTNFPLRSPLPNSHQNHGYEQENLSVESETSQSPSPRLQPNDHQESTAPLPDEEYGQPSTLLSEGRPSNGEDNFYFSTSSSLNQNNIIQPNAPPEELHEPKMSEEQLTDGGETLLRVEEPSLPPPQYGELTLIGQEPPAYDDRASYPLRSLPPSGYEDDVSMPLESAPRRSMLDSEVSVRDSYQPSPSPIHEEQQITDNEESGFSFYPFSSLHQELQPTVPTEELNSLPTSHMSEDRLDYEIHHSTSTSPSPQNDSESEPIVPQEDLHQPSSQRSIEPATDDEDSDFTSYTPTSPHQENRSQPSTLEEFHDQQPPQIIDIRFEDNVELDRASSYSLEDNDIEPETSASDLLTSLTMPESRAAVYINSDCPFSSYVSHI